MQYLTSVERKLEAGCISIIQVSTISDNTQYRKINGSELILRVAELLEHLIYLSILPSVGDNRRFICLKLILYFM